MRIRSGDKVYNNSSTYSKNGVKKKRVEMTSSNDILEKDDNIAVNIDGDTLEISDESYDACKKDK
ncbi:MAG: hypothetical protein K6G26_07610 [Lachnospiraceae bacterium]|nr:hypothetical protein [Lachnospiraceae bacterium]